MRTQLPARYSQSALAHIGGCYFTGSDRHRTYLPQISLTSHATINSLYFSTRLVQTFHNASDESLPQIRYAFPLYDGVTVNGYTISYADTVLNGVVKQKEDAKQAYQAAVERGETAGLLEACPAGVFGVVLGNIPPKTDIVVEITYCGELKHDAAIDGIRYTLPTSIAPRYGTHPGIVLQSNAIASSGISITVDIDTMQAAIRRVQSPSHPIAVSMGEISTATGKSDTPSPYLPSQASASLTLGTTELAADFVLQFAVDGIGEPSAVIEQHPTLPNQRAIMASLVPKFALKSANPEVVFVVDQSGSMHGTKNTALVSALKVFLKSLPLGVRFNICAFGTQHQFLWPRSQAYNEPNASTAAAFIQGFAAQLGGTKILEPMKAVFDSRLGDLPLEVMLLTDGEIWGEDTLFEYINAQIRDEKVDARVFALGFGSDVSHTLIEGVARAGNGFAQFVTGESHADKPTSHSYEDLDQKIVRMLKAALYAHTNDYQLEVHYADSGCSDVESEEFELIDKVEDCLQIIDDPPAYSNAQENSHSEKKSFFDSSVNLDEPLQPTTTPNDRYAHLPNIETPKILQAPTFIPALFPFNRSYLYLLLGPKSQQLAVRSVTLRARSVDGPLELSIPVHDIGVGSAIHQLGARKAVQDLEEGRGWLQMATVGTEAKLAKDVFASRLDEIVERESVSLGVQYQVAGKWTSFVAVQSGSEILDQLEDAQDAQDEEGLSEQAGPKYVGPKKKRKMVGSTLQPYWASPIESSPPTVPGVSAGLRFGPSSFGATSSQGSTSSLMSTSSYAPVLASNRPASIMSSLAAPVTSSDRRDESSVGSLFGSAVNRFSSAGSGGRGGALSPLFRGAPQAKHPEGLTSNSAEAASQHRDLEFTAAGPGNTSGIDLGDGAHTRVAQRSAPRRQMMSQPATQAVIIPGAGPTAEQSIDSADPLAKMRRLIDKQAFDGSWLWTDGLFRLLGVDQAAVDKAKFGQQDTLAATAIAIAYLEKDYAEKQGAWMMVVEKAKAWLTATVGGDESRMGELVKEGAICVGARV